MVEKIDKSLHIKIKIPSNSLLITTKNIPITKLSFDNFMLEDVPVWSEDIEEYELYPNSEKDQILFTNNKKLKNDIIIHKIPYYEVSNEAGGLTISINS